MCRSLGLPDKHFFLFEPGSLYIALTVWNLLCIAGWPQTQRDRPASAYRLLELKSAATLPGSVPQCHDVQCSTFTWWATWLGLWLGNLKQKKCNGMLSRESLVQDPGFYMTISYGWSLHCERMRLCAPQCRLTKLWRLICLTEQGVNSCWELLALWETKEQMQRAGASDSAVPCETELDKWVFVPCFWCAGLVVGKCIRRLGFHLALLSLLKISHRCQTSWVIFIHDYVEENDKGHQGSVDYFP